MVDEKRARREALPVELGMSGIITDSHPENGITVIDGFRLDSVSYIKIADSLEGLKTAEPIEQLYGNPPRCEFVIRVNRSRLLEHIRRVSEAAGREWEKVFMGIFAAPEPMPVNVRCPACKEPMRPSLSVQAFYCADPVCEHYNEQVSYSQVRAQEWRYR